MGRTSKGDRSMMRRLASLFVLAVALGLILCVGGCKTDSESVDSAGSEESAEAPAEESRSADIAEFAIGESFSFNDLTWTVTAVDTYDEIESMFSDTEPHQPANGTWVVVTMEFTGAESLGAGGWNTDATMLCDGNGTLYEEEEPSGAADDYRLTHDGVKNLSWAMVGDSSVQKVFGAVDCDDIDALDPADPAKYVTPGDPPVLMIHGNQDQAVPLGYSTYLQQKLEQANIFNVLLVVEGAGHSYDLSGRQISPDFSHIIEFALQFLEVTLR